MIYTTYYNNKGFLNLFAYGTLMYRDIMKEVSGCLPRYIPALLHGFRRYRIKGANYPGIVEEAGSSVKGIVYIDVPKSAWIRLDEYEGNLYERRPLRIETMEGDTLVAFTYVIHKKFIHIIEPVSSKPHERLDREATLE